MIYRAYANGKEIKEFNLGGKQINEIWGGDVLLWKRGYEKISLPYSIVKGFVRTSAGEHIFSVYEDGKYKLGTFKNTFDYLERKIITGENSMNNIIEADGYFYPCTLWERLRTSGASVISSHNRLSILKLSGNGDISARSDDIAFEVSEYNRTFIKAIYYLSGEMHVLVEYGTAVYNTISTNPWTYNIVSYQKAGERICKLSIGSTAVTGFTETSTDITDSAEPINGAMCNMGGTNYYITSIFGIYAVTGSTITKVIQGDYAYIGNFGGHYLFTKSVQRNKLFEFINGTMRELLSLDESIMIFDGFDGTTGCYYNEEIYIICGQMVSPGVDEYIVICIGNIDNINPKTVYKNPDDRSHITSIYIENEKLYAFHYAENGTSLYIEAI